LLVTIPAYAWLWSGHDAAHHHYRRYTAEMLRRRAEAAGLTVSRLGYFNSPSTLTQTDPFMLIKTNPQRT
jgi:chromosome condensin MukBEF complex kleisin-like MukF subunit